MRMLRLDLRAIRTYHSSAAHLEPAHMESEDCNVSAASRGPEWPEVGSGNMARACLGCWCSTLQRLGPWSLLHHFLIIVIIITIFIIIMIIIMIIIAIFIIMIIIIIITIFIIIMIIIMIIIAIFIITIIIIIITSFIIIINSHYCFAFLEAYSPASVGLWALGFGVQAQGFGLMAPA